MTPTERYISRTEHPRAKRAVHADERAQAGGRGSASRRTYSLDELRSRGRPGTDRPTPVIPGVSYSGGGGDTDAYDSSAGTTSRATAATATTPRIQAAAGRASLRSSATTQPFDLPDTALRVWHGTADENAPLAPVRNLATEVGGEYTSVDADHLGTLLECRRDAIAWLSRES